ncbi:unnamed protein product [Pieris macdunnoughi]|uniref:tRNA (uracil(54)-C(5))-methyltransferase n=1 Tax=Pieris macdunnoughi TaxID=345717 RepID=A0A821WU74_9NEOP|nr:unnamed protein product [Pieris macdunnoughi]
MTEEVTTNEEYAYLDRGGFSSEKYKIELRGLPKFYGIAELKKLMNQKLGLSVSKIKRQKFGNHWLYACFQNDEERDKAITALNGYEWKGKKLIAEIAKPAPDPLVKRKQECKGNDKNPKRQKTEVDETKSQEERLKDAVIPYWKLPYEEQLTLKTKEIKQVLMKFDNELWKIDKQKRSKIEDNRKLYDGLSFELKPIERSPFIEGYRNKCEFTVGIDEETKKPTVGFRLGCYWAGSVAVAPVQVLKHIPENMKKAVLVFQEFIRKSELPPYSPVDYSGYWKCLTVRQSSHNGDIMLIIAMDPQILSADEREKMMEEINSYFISEESCGIKSVYVHFVAKRRAGEEPAKPIHVLGATHITDTILGRQFRISPEAFFQINTAGAEILYQKAIDLSRVNDNSTLIDVCCGTGTIGLCFAKHCGQVLGLELIEKAVEDARANALLNNIENCEFYAGKAETTLHAVLARASADDVIAVVDPPRAGLHMSAITTLRNNKKVKRLIYISCSPASVTKNFVDLSRASSKTLHGAPFIPICAVPVDMFPHTKHVELIVLFEREQEPSNEVADIVKENTEDEKTLDPEVKTDLEDNQEDIDDTLCIEI